jgi:asparagine synthase (glutamine-hydrolysing)
VCGIAGIVRLSSESPPARNELEAMIDRVPHRGPDDVGVFCAEEVGLAHARLSIIDLAGGRQPIHNEDRTVWVVFNGEIFNYVELRRELVAQGHSFYTQSDTEVIVHLYEQHGDDFLRHMNGQWALALWDARRRRLLLARDRAGIRPLFHAQAAGRLHFASEVKSLFALPQIRRELDPRGIAQTFTFWSSLPPGTMFSGVQALPPGHLMVVEDGRVAVRPFWDWQFPVERPEERPLKAYVEEVRALMIDAVRIRLRADVPVGAYLSGGLDSSIITALIRNFTDSPLRTFSVGFEDEEFDEGPFQRELVQHLGTNHTALHVSRRAIGEAFPRTIWHTEAPIVRTAPTPLMLLSERVRAENFKVVLTGEGADEVFGGYDLFKEARIRRFWARDRASRIRPSLLRRLYPWLKSSPTSAQAFSEGFFGQGLDELHRPWFAHAPRWLTTRRAWRFFGPALRDAVRNFEFSEELAAILPPDIERWAPLCRDQYIEAKTLLSGYLLSSQGDRVAMANSVEGRFPFLDYRVIEFASQLPVRFKLAGLTEKFLLRRAFADLLPPSIARRTKQPYRAPDSQSFFSDGAPLPWVAALFDRAALRRTGYFDPEPTRRLYEKCRANRALGFADNMAFVGILSTLLVHELFIERRSPSEISHAHAPITRPPATTWRNTRAAP